MFPIIPIIIIAICMWSDTLSYNKASISWEVAISAASYSPVNTLTYLQICDTTLTPPITNLRLEFGAILKLKSGLVKILIYTSENITSLILKLSPNMKILYSRNNLCPIISNLQILLFQEINCLNQSVFYSSCFGFSFHRFFIKEKTKPKQEKILKLLIQEHLQSSMQKKAERERGQVIEKILSIPVIGTNLFLRLGSGYIKFRYLFSLSGMLAIFNPQKYQYNWRSLSISYGRSLR